MKRIMGLMIILFSFTAISAQTNENEESAFQKISLDKFITKAVKNYPQVPLNRYYIESSKAQLKQSKAVNDININAEAAYSTEKPTPTGTSSAEKQGATEIDVTAEKVLPFSGTRLSAGFGIQDSFADYSGYNRTYFTPSVSISVQQPILKNWLGLLDRLPTKQAELSLKQSREREKDLNEEYLSYLHSLYYDWVLTSEQLEIYSINYKNSLILLKQIQKKYRSRVADEVDLNETRALTIKYKKAKLQYQNQLASIEKEIIKYYTGSSDYDLKIKPDYTINKKNFQNNIQYLSVSNTRKMRILKYSKKMIDNELSGGKNSLWPDLNFLAGAKFKSLSQDERSFNEFEYNEYMIGLSLVYPLGTHLERGKLDELESDKEKLKNEIKEFILIYNYNYSRLIDTLNVYQDILKEDQQLISTTKKQLKAEEKKYQQGRSDLSFVIQARNTLLDSELDFIKDFMEYKKLYIQYLDLTDHLYNKYFSNEPIED